MDTDSDHSDRGVGDAISSLVRLIHNQQTRIRQSDYRRLGSALFRSSKCNRNSTIFDYECGLTVRTGAADRKLAYLYALLGDTFPTPPIIYQTNRPIPTTQSKRELEVRIVDILQI